MNAEQTVQFIRLFFELIGAATILTAVILGFLTFLGWGIGIFPLMKRLGLGRRYRKVLIVAEEQSGQSLKKDLDDSGVFRLKNIDVVGGNSLSDIKNADLILLDYQSFDGEQIKTAIGNKQKSAGLVVYSPMGAPLIPPEISAQINKEPFTTLVNMRGRLVNDLLITLMSTSYDKKRR